MHCSQAFKILYLIAITICLSCQKHTIQDSHDLSSRDCTPVKAYEQAHYKGKVWEFGCQPLPPHHEWNDKVSSLRVSGHQVKLCTDIKNSKPSGSCRIYNNDVPEIHAKFNNKSSYISVKKLSSEISLAIVSDTQYHWKCHDKCAKLQPRNVKSQAQLSNDWQWQSIEAQAQKSTHSFRGIIINGDLTAFGHKSEFDNFKKRWIDQNQFKIWPGLGNHDYANNVNDCFENNCALRMVHWFYDYVKTLQPIDFDASQRRYHKSPSNRQKTSGSLAYSWDLGDFHFIQLNNYASYTTKFHGWNFAKARRDHADIANSINWLKNDLKTTKQKYIIINLHDTDKDLEHEEYKKVLESDSRIVAIFAGHYHQLSGFQGYQSGKGKLIPIFYSGGSEYNTYLYLTLSRNKMTVEQIWSQDGLPQKLDAHTYDLDKPHKYSKLAFGKTSFGSCNVAYKDSQIPLFCEDYYTFNPNFHHDITLRCRNILERLQEQDKKDFIAGYTNPALLEKLEPKYSHKPCLRNTVRTKGKVPKHYRKVARCDLGKEEGFLWKTTWFYSQKGTVLQQDKLHCPDYYDRFQWLHKN